VLAVPGLLAEAAQATDKHDGEELNGEVLAAVSDRHGGYYVGGCSAGSAASPA
jgi:hypothetical protein